MNTATKRGWKWAYRTMRDLHCSRASASYRATLYCLRGDTGTFVCDLTHKKIRINR